MYSFGQKILDIVVEEYGITLPNIDSCLSYPPKPDLGDFAFSCFTISKEIKANPNEIATRLATLFNNVKNTFTSASSMGGYVNFHLNSSIFIEDLYKINLNQKPNNNETIIVDYIGANVGKPLHIGHLCTPSVGQTIINTYKHLGYNVISDSHFGDWGGIFGKLIYAWNTRKTIIDHEDKPEYNLNKYGVDYLLWLYQYYHELVEDISNQAKNKYGVPVDKTKEDFENGARREFQFLSGVGIDLNNPKELVHHEENVELWKKFTAISIEEVSKQLDEELNIKPQYNIGESFYEGLGLPRPNDEKYPPLKYDMKAIVKELVEHKDEIARKNEDGSVGVVFPEEAKMPSCVLQKKDGTGLYLTSDLAAIKYRITSEWKDESGKVLPKVSKIIYCVDVRQQLHLKQVFDIAHRAWDDIGLKNISLFHAYNGFIELKEGAMSTRKGTVIFLKDLIDQGYNKTNDALKEKGRELSPKNVKAITIGAIKYSYLSQDREKNIVFDWDKALSFEGNSGPYIQYAYVRASKIVHHAVPSAGSASIDPESSSGGRFAGTELSQYDKSLIKKLNEFEGKIQETANKYKPHIIAQYCYELASEFNSFYVNTPRILEEQDESLRNIRLTIINKIKEVLHKGFELLAIDMPDEM